MADPNLAAVTARSVAISPVIAPYPWPINGSRVRDRRVSEWRPGLPCQEPGAQGGPLVLLELAENVPGLFAQQAGHLFLNLGIDILHAA